MASVPELQSLKFLTPADHVEICCSAPYVPDTLFRLISPRFSLYCKRRIDNCDLVVENEGVEKFSVSGAQIPQHKITVYIDPEISVGSIDRQGKTISMTRTGVEWEITKADTYIDCAGSTVELNKSRQVVKVSFPSGESTEFKAMLLSLGINLAFFSTPGNSQMLKPPTTWKKFTHEYEVREVSDDDSMTQSATKMDVDVYDPFEEMGQHWLIKTMGKNIRTSFMVVCNSAGKVIFLVKLYQLFSHDIHSPAIEVVDTRGVIMFTMFTPRISEATVKTSRTIGTSSYTKLTDPSRPEKAYRERKWTIKIRGGENMIMWCINKTVYDTSHPFTKHGSEIVYAKVFNPTGISFKFNVDQNLPENAKKCILAQYIKLASLYFKLNQIGPLVSEALTTKCVCFQCVGSSSGNMAALNILSDLHAVHLWPIGCSPNHSTNYFAVTEGGDGRVFFIFEMQNTLHNSVLKSLDGEVIFKVTVEEAGFTLWSDKNDEYGKMRNDRMLGGKSFWRNTFFDASGYQVLKMAEIVRQGRMELEYGYTLMNVPGHYKIFYVYAITQSNSHQKSLVIIKRNQKITGDVSLKWAFALVAGIWSNNETYQLKNHTMPHAWLRYAVGKDKGRSYSFYTG